MGQILGGVEDRDHIPGNNPFPTVFSPPNTASYFTDYHQTAAFAEFHADTIQAEDGRIELPGPLRAHQFSKLARQTNIRLSSK